MGSDVIAIVSDIHANIEALEVVLADIDRQGIDRIVCLGDVIGYGPDPIPCLDHALNWDVSLMGNHEEAVLNGSFGMSALAKEAIDWTREQLQPVVGDPLGQRRWDFLEQMPLCYVEDNLLFVHGSPRDPTVEYILKGDCEDLFGDVPEKIRSIFDLVPHLCFVGHSHTPCVITEDATFMTPADFGGQYVFDKSQRYICNVGSVGQPRDGNNKACYTTYDGRSLTWHRLPYAYKETVAKIRQVGELGERSATRLEQGR